MGKAVFVTELGTITDYTGQGDVFCGDQRHSSPLVHPLHSCPISPLYFPISDFFLVADWISWSSQNYQAASIWRVIMWCLFTSSYQWISSWVGFMESEIMNTSVISSTKNSKALNTSGHSYFISFLKNFLSWPLNQFQYPLHLYSLKFKTLEYLAVSIEKACDSWS